MDNNIVSLKNWLSRHKSSDDYIKLFYNMDKTMKDIHDRGYFITSFNQEDIFTNGDIVKYLDTMKMDNDHNDYYVNQNIYYLSCMAIGVYNDCLSYINPQNKSGLKENYSSFSSLIPSDVSGYYYGIIVNDYKDVYLSEFMDKKREMKSLNGGNSSSLEKGKTLTLGTQYGKMYAYNDKSAAFISIVLFPTIIFLLALIIPIMIFLT